MSTGRTNSWKLPAASMLTLGLLATASTRLVCAQEPAVPASNPVPIPVQPVVPIPTASTPQVPGTLNGPVAVPIAIVPVQGVELTGALKVAQGKAVIGTSGSVTAGKHTATVTLPHRGELKICATTKVSLTADSSVQTKVAPGLMMALDRGALEARFATGLNSDVILTPDFRILISAPGVADVRVRLGDRGDTCVDNRGPNAPYVTVSSVFDGGVYRVQPDQRVMFQHGSLSEVVDNERESCGCPPEPQTLPEGNEFPVAQSEGMAPPPPLQPKGDSAGTTSADSAQLIAQLAFDATKAAPATQPASSPATPEAAKPEAAKVAPPAPTPATTPVPTAPSRPAKKGGLRKIGRFFKRLFGG